MTTIVANLECMAADRFVTYAPSYNGDWKIWVARKSLWGAAGDVEHCLKFRLWTEGKGKRPVKIVADGEEKGEAKIEVLQLSAEGLFLWVGDSPADAVKEPFYAIGSGAGYAVGAMSKGATLEESLQIAAKWDTNTRLPFHILALADIKKRKRA